MTHCALQPDPTIPDRREHLTHLSDICPDDLQASGPVGSGFISVCMIGAGRGPQAFLLSGGGPSVYV